MICIIQIIKDGYKLKIMLHILKQNRMLEVTSFYDNDYVWSIVIVLLQNGSLKIQTLLNPLHLVTHHKKATEAVK